jgi:predicted PhzF superfamily epimerase YddE/YHI9
MPLDFWIVNVLSREPFRGTPASVFLVSDLDDRDLLSNVATEINTPESAFITQKTDRDFAGVFISRLGIDIGSGVLAAAKVVSRNNPDLLEFRIKSGVDLFDVRVLKDQSIVVSFETEVIEKAIVPANMYSALGGEISVSVAKCGSDLIIELRSPKKLFNLSPNTVFLKSMGYDSFILTADTHYGTELNYDFCFRVFAPGFGGAIREILSPMASIKLAAYWSRRMSKDDVVGLQSRPDSHEPDGVYTHLCVENATTSIRTDCVISTVGSMVV